MQFCAFVFNSNELRGTWNILYRELQLETKLKRLDGLGCQLELAVFFFTETVSYFSSFLPQITPSWFCFSEERSGAVGSEVSLSGSPCCL